MNIMKGEKQYNFLNMELEEFKQIFKEFIKNKLEMLKNKKANKRKGESQNIIYRTTSIYEDFLLKDDYECMFNHHKDMFKEYGHNTLSSFVLINFTGDFIKN